MFQWLTPATTATQPQQTTTAQTAQPAGAATHHPTGVGGTPDSLSPQQQEQSLSGSFLGAVKAVGRSVHDVFDPGPATVTEETPAPATEAKPATVTEETPVSETSGEGANANTAESTEQEEGCTFCTPFYWVGSIFKSIGTWFADLFLCIVCCRCSVKESDSAEESQ